MAHPKLKLELNRLRWDDAGPAPAGFRPDETVLNPVNLEMVRDPLMYHALYLGFADFRGEKHEIDLSRFVSTLRATKQRPLYSRLTERQIETFEKLRDPDYGVMGRLTWFAKVFGCSRDTAGRKLMEWKVPLYLTDWGMMFFIGDLAKAIESRRIDLAAYGQAELRYLYREELRRARAEDRRTRARPPKIAREEAPPEERDRRGDDEGAGGVRRGSDARKHRIRPRSFA